MEATPSSHVVNHLQANAQPISNIISTPHIEFSSQHMLTFTSRPHPHSSQKHESAQLIPATP